MFPILNKEFIESFIDRLDHNFNLPPLKNYNKRKVDKDGDIFYTLNGKLHRLDGPAVIYTCGDKEWWFNGKWHREDGPAVEYINGNKYWYRNGKKHRLDGPAVEYPDGYKIWYINGIEYFKEEYPQAVEKYISNHLTP